MSQLREFAGKGWHEWPSTGDSEDISLASSPSHSDLASGDITPSSSRASSPPPHLNPKDDVTKLPRHEMHLFGQCPVQDEFLMAVCDSCHQVIKLEAFASHVKHRHGLPLKLTSTSSSSARSGRSSSKSNVKPCSVDLLKLSAKLKTERAGSSSISSSSNNSCPPPSRSKTPTPDKELAPPISISPPNVVSSTVFTPDVISLHEDEPMEVEDIELPSRIPTPVTRISTPVTRVSTPVTRVSTPVTRVSTPVTRVSTPVTRMSTPVECVELEVKPVVDDVEPYMTKFEQEDADIENTSNVISIPDTDPLPHNMSGDLMAMVSEVTRPMELEDLQTQMSPVIKLQVQQDDSVATTLVLAPSGLPGTPLPAISSPFSRPPLPQAIVVQSPSNNHGGIKTLLPSTPESYKSLVKQSPGKKGGSGGNRFDRKPLREYHPDKHCGVWDSEGGRNCTRALTCKSHSVLLKRKVEGRCRSFDELLGAHKKAQAALAAAAAVPTVSTVTTINLTPTVVSLPTTPVAPSSIMHTVQLNGGARSGIITLAKPPPQIMFPLTPLQPQVYQQTYHVVPKEIEEPLYYTMDHPKPLAVCNFGGRRIGGLMFSDRSKLLTRKLVRVAITTAMPGGNRSSGISGFHRIGPRLALFPGEAQPPLAIVNGLKRARDSKDSPTFLLNYSLGGKRTVVGSGLSSGPATPTMNLSTLQPGSSVVIPDSFKTDIQDFKGGIKFELGSKIKHIHLPTGSE